MRNMSNCHFLISKRMQVIDTTTLDNIIVGRVDPYIYAFTTETVPNYLKVGDTYRRVDVRLNEWRKYFANLKLQCKYKAKTEDGQIFRDYSVHRFLEEEKGCERLTKGTFPNVYYSNEFFKNAHKEDVNDAINDIIYDAKIKAGKYQLYSPKRLPETFHYERNQNFGLRPNQQETVNNFVNAIKNGRTNLLMYAVMRFGKSFTAMCCSKEMDNCNITLVVSAKADVRTEWKKTIESHVFFSNYIFLDKDNLNDLEAIESVIKDKKRAVIFLTLQDLAGDIIKERHKQLLSSQIDLLIVDETHYGARATELGKILRATGITKRAELDSESQERDIDEDFEQNDKIVKSLKAKVKLHLSGTPYRILMGDEFAKEDIIAFCQFTDVVELQQQWDELRLSQDEIKQDGSESREWDNPYFGFPQMIRFAFRPNASSLAKMKIMKEQGISLAMSALFKPMSIVKDATNNKHKKFVNEQEIIDLLTVIDGSKQDANILGFLDYDKIKEGQMCHHIVCVLPYRASCDALEELLKVNSNKFKNLSQYEILNISGVEINTNTLTNEDIKRKISNWENNGKKSITLTVNRMLTGSTVEQWDTMLYFKDTASPQEYDQAVFRLQNQFIKTYVDENGQTIKFNMKPQTVLVDFDPERMFRMQELKSQFYNANTDERGNQKLEERIQRELEISPIIILNHNKLTKVTPTNIMDVVRQYSQNKSIADESLSIPFDFSLLDIEIFRKEVEALKEIDDNKGIEIRPISDEEVDDMDIPNGDNNSNTNNNQREDKDNKEHEVNENSSLEKKLATYYSKILFFAFLTDHTARSLKDIIRCIEDNAEDHRIAKNLGLKLSILNLIQDKANAFILSKLDYKIQSLNNLMCDHNIEPVIRAEIAMKKFARLSNSEVVTPSIIADELVEIIPQTEIKADTIFLDIASVQGEMACAIYRKYGEALKEKVYSIPTSSLTYELTLKVYRLLGFPIDHVLDFYSYDLLNDEDGIYSNRLNEIHPQIVCGVPPFNKQAEGGRGDGGIAIYHHFFKYVKDTICPRYICMMMQSTWYTGGRGDGLEEFREYMLSKNTDDKHIRELHDYPDITAYIKGVTTLRGGVCLFLWDKEYNGNCRVINRINHHDYEWLRPLRYCKNGYEADFFIRWNKGLTILDKVLSQEHEYFNSHMYKRDPFKFVENGSDNWIAKQKKIKKRNIKVYLASGKWGYVSTDDFTKEKGDNELLNKWKVLIAKSSSGGDEIPHLVISDPIVSEPKSVTAHTHYAIEGVTCKIEAHNLVSYMKTKFFRFMVFLLRSNQNMRIDMYQFAPWQDFSHAWTDEMLFEKYHLTEDEIEFINLVIRERN